MFVLLVFPPQRVANDAVDAFLKYVLQWYVSCSP